MNKGWVTLLVMTDKTKLILYLHMNIMTYNMWKNMA